MTGKKTNGAGDTLGTDKTLWGSRGQRIEMPPTSVTPSEPQGAAEPAKAAEAAAPAPAEPVEYDGPMQVIVQPRVENGQPFVNLSLVWKVKGEDKPRHDTATLSIYDGSMVAASIQNAIIEAQVEAQARVETQLLQAWLTAQSRFTNARNVPDLGWAMDQMRSYQDFRVLAMRSFQAIRSQAEAQAQDQDQAPAAEPEGGVP